MIIQGSAGSGKTHLLHAFRALLDSKDIPYVCCSFTGNSAFNCSGTTFHYQLRIPRNFREANVKPSSADLYTKFRKIKYMFMDELSMIGSAFAGFVSERLKVLKYSDEPFGGLHFVMLGDLYQLRPVCDRMIFLPPHVTHDNPNEKTLEEWGYEAYRSINIAVILEETKRQEDLEFIQLLNRVRKGIVNDDDIKKLNERAIEKEDGEINSNLTEEELLSFAVDSICLNPEHKPAQTINRRRILNSASEDNVPIEIFPILKVKVGQNFTENSEEIRTKIVQDGAILVSIGTRVFLNKNIAPYIGFFNGSTGTIRKILKDENDDVVCIYVHFDKGSGPKFMDQDVFPVTRMETPHYGKAGEESFTSYMFPLEIAFALTVHKVQSLTMDKVLVSVPDRRVVRSSMWATFAPALFYTSISRVRRLEDLAFDHEISQDMYVSNGPVFALVQEEEQRLIALELFRTENYNF